MTFAERLEQGLTEFGAPERTIETPLSKLFFFGERVLKVYKHQAFFFADLKDPASRRKFYEDDFFWNHASAPEIYLRLAEAEGDLYIEMRKIDGSQSLTNLLSQDRVTVPQMEQMAEALVSRVRFLTKEKMPSLRYLLAGGWKSIWDEYARHDLSKWMYLADTRISRAETDRLANILQAASEKEKYFNNFDLSLLSVQIDNNSDNLLFLEGKPSFIDSMPPKEDWRIFDEAGIVARTAVDAYVLGSKELGDAVHRVYAKYRSTPPFVKTIYELRAALIQWPFRFLLGQNDVAEKFGAYARTKAEELKALI